MSYPTHLTLRNQLELTNDPRNMNLSTNYEKYNEVSFQKIANP